MVHKRFHVEAVQYFMALYIYIYDPCCSAKDANACSGDCKPSHDDKPLSAVGPPDKVDRTPFPPPHPDLIFDLYSY
jgi:hypothetical protein